jgi:hypothetical protein
MNNFAKRNPIGLEGFCVQSSCAFCMLGFHKTGLNPSSCGNMEKLTKNNFITFAMVISIVYHFNKKAYKPLIHLQFRKCVGKHPKLNQVERIISFTFFFILYYSESFILFILLILFSSFSLFFLFHFHPCF